MGNLSETFTLNSNVTTADRMPWFDSTGAEHYVPISATLRDILKDQYSPEAGGLTNWEESGTTLQPTTAGYAFGAVGNEVGNIVSSGNLDLTGDIILGGDAYLKRIDADHIGMYNGVTPQSLSLYNTYTDASNYERGGMAWSGNVLEVSTGAAGTGTQRDLKLTADGSGNGWELTGTTLKPTTAGYDLGATGNEVGDIVSSGTVVSTQLACTPSPGTASSDQLVLNTHHGINSTGSYMRFRVNTEQLAAFYRSSFKGLGITSGGAISWGSNGLSSFQTYLRHIASNHLGMYNGVNPQSFSVYNTYTDASNYERGGMRWDTNALVIGTEAAGTGSGRDVHIKNLPTSNPGPGILWNNAGTPAIGT